MNFEEWWDKTGFMLYGNKNVVNEIWQAAQPQWQPIETAPTNGSEIILCDEGVGVSYSGYFENRPNYWNEIGFQELDCRHGAYVSSRIKHPTHWQPLPEPPNV